MSGNPVTEAHGDWQPAPRGLAFSDYGEWLDEGTTSLTEDVAARVIDDDPVVASAAASLTATSRLETQVTARGFSFMADEPRAGTVGAGPTPMEYLLIALVSCTAITLRQYADRKYDYAGDIMVEVRYHEPRAEGAAGYLQRVVSLSERVPEPDLGVMMDLAERTPVTLLLQFAWSVRTDFHNP
jgi:putative redox protein